MEKFAHLHTHSHYSLLAALPKIPDLVAAAKKEGCTALALTDRHNLYGAIEFYKECKHAGIKPIIGLDANLEDNHRILLYAQNEQGYKNLLALVTESNLREHEGPPSLSRDMLQAHAGGLIAAVPAREHGKLDEYKNIFGAENFYDNVALAEIYYLSPRDHRAWETMRAIEKKNTEDGSLGAEEEDFSFLSAKEMNARFKDMPDALANTCAIADRCNLELTIGTFIFPEFPLPPGTTADEVLRELCLAGLERRGLQGRADVLERLEYELGIIAFKGYAAYFLVVEDLIRFAHEHGIYTTIRGSVAGSMTTYLLHITTIDPLAYNIPFERFLNPERPSAPDIDMDFADDRRDEVIEYARNKYGHDKVAQIGTFGTMLARGVVRDVSRALGYPYGLGDRIAKEIPMGSQGFPMTLARALDENAALKKIYDEEAEAKEIIDLGRTIEGCARHISVHAAGVVIAPTALVNYSPMQRDPKGGKIISQYDMYSVGEDGVGLTKFDFLGIRNLSILADAVGRVKKIRGIEIDIENIPIDDKKTFEMLARGETEGTFQLNGSGMTRYLKELRPSTIFDINAMVALFRPGPMQFIPLYIERKHDPSLVSYLDPAMEPILKQTYGVLVYQDDLLIMAHEFAGYSWGEVDKFRKAVGKKIPEEMQKQKEKFIAGCVEHAKWPRKKAEKIWEWIEPFAAYGFNKAHAASYGKVAYQTAYMKANFPVEYMASVLTAESGDLDTVSIMVAECKRMGITVLPPDINESFGDFTVVGDSIRFGLTSIKNFGAGIGAAIIAERNTNGNFATLSDFLSRVKTDALNKRGLESLIECGALDRLGERGQMVTNIELLLQFHRDATKEHSHDSLFGSIDTGAGDVRMVAAEPASMMERLAWEKELLGLYVSGHPLDRFREVLSTRPMTITEMKTKVQPGLTVVAAGMIEDVRIILTRGGDQMAFIKIADFDGSIEAVVFPKLFLEKKDIVKSETVIAIKGKLSSRNGELSIAAENIKAL
jgi:DNA polymerase-3 subunit alpha